MAWEMRGNKVALEALCSTGLCARVHSNRKRLSRAEEQSALSPSVLQQGQEGSVAPPPSFQGR